jgi:hypothetical protein
MFPETIRGIPLSINIFQCLKIYCRENEAKIDHNILDLTYVIPLEIIAMALPISISGIGVGHLAFFKLIGLFGIMSGADIFTIYFACSYVFNLIGLVPFLMLQKKR